MPAMAVFDREIIKNILIRDFSSFHDRMSQHHHEHDPLVFGE